MKNTKALEPPATIIAAMITAVIAMLLMTIWRRPILSDRWPAIGRR